jgi:predicted nucleic acid-binding protein
MIDIKKTPSQKTLQATAKMGTVSIGICSVMKSALKFKFERYAEKVVNDSKAEFTFINVDPEQAERAVRFLSKQFRVNAHRVVFNRASEQHRLIMEVAI